MNAFNIGDSLIDLAAPEHLREEIAGDLREHFRRIEVAQGSGAARKSYWRDLARSLLPLVVLKTMTEVRARWQLSVAMGGGAAIALFLFLWTDWYHFSSPWTEFGALAAIVLIFMLAFKRPQIGAAVTFVAGLFVVEVIDLAFTPSERHMLYGTTVYLTYLPTAAVLFLVAFIGLLIRTLFRRSHT